MQLMASSLRFWVGFGLVVLALAVAGPFGTRTIMDLSNRLIYWSIICIITVFVGAAISSFVVKILIKHQFAKWSAGLVGGLVAGPPIAFVVWIINVTIFNFDMESTYSLSEFVVYTSIISSVIVMLRFLMSDNNWSDMPETNENDTCSAFFSRLPVNLGKSMISIEAQDHYINVKTSRGSALILMRLKDAQKELSSFRGLRVHRSWWVAVDAIESVKRENGRMTLVLEDGTIVPVSRNSVKLLKDVCKKLNPNFKLKT